ncbi:MAG: AAA family ATPase [Desulfobacterales bacterium]
MYASRYGLAREPFSIQPDPAFLWLSDKHAAALETLKEGILERDGPVVVTGDIGTGKTTLIRHLVRLDEVAAIFVTIHDPDLTPLDFLNLLAVEFGIEGSFENREEFHTRLRRFLLEAFSSYRKVLIIIDEAQRLNAALLHEAVDLARIELAGRRLLKVFFLGQLEFDQMLAREENRDLLAAVSAYYRIEPFTAEETRRYIAHRLEVAGRIAPLFTEEALGEIHRLTHGVPRLINILCGHALLYGFSGNCETIGADTVRECTRDLTVALELEEGADRTAPEPSPVAQSIASRREALPGGRRGRGRLLLFALGALAAAVLVGLAFFFR